MKKQSLWQTYRIEVRFEFEKPYFIDHTVKARSKEEAEKKAAKYLQGRGRMFFTVHPWVNKGQTISTQSIPLSPNKDGVEGEAASRFEPTSTYP